MIYCIYVCHFSSVLSGCWVDTPLPGGPHGELALKTSDDEDDDPQWSSIFQALRDFSPYILPTVAEYDHLSTWAGSMPSLSHDISEN